MLTLISTALAALAGSLLGAYFTRQAQHHKWLLDRRAEAFGQLLELVAQGQRLATDHLHNRSLDGPELEVKVLDAYVPMLNQVRIVRLYLPRTRREEVSRLTKEYWAVHSQKSLGSQRIERMDGKIDRIQAIFEEELSPHYWLRPVGRWWKRQIGAADA